MSNKQAHSLTDKHIEITKCLYLQSKLGMRTWPYDPSTQEAEAEGLLAICEQPGLNSESQVSQIFRVRSYLKSQNKNKLG